jgi:hypothetical protein
VRKETIWIYAHPDEERFFTQTTPVTCERGTQLRRHGYTIFKTDVTFPPSFSTAAQPIENTGLSEQWEGKDEDTVKS